MKRLAKLEVYETPGGWTVRYMLEGEPVRETRGWRSLLTALDQIGKLIAQKVTR